MSGLKAVGPLYRIINSLSSYHGGRLVIGGVEISEPSLLEYLESGASIDDYLAAFPAIDRPAVVGFLDEVRRRLVSELIQVLPLIHRILPDYLETLWQKYVRLEDECMRESARKTLIEFCDGITTLDPRIRERWVVEVCTEVYDQNRDIKLREHVIRGVILPVLLRRSSEGDARASRWLAQMFPIVRSTLVELGIYPTRLKQLSLQQDPTYSLARRDLIDDYAEMFDFSIHDVPAGVLYGMNGASKPQCEELIKDLDHLEELVALEGIQQEYAERIAEWRYYFTTYLQYLKTDTPRSGYGVFLSARRERYFEP